MSVKSIFITLAVLSAAAIMSAGLSSCNDGKTYAQLLNEENHYVNNFLADQRVIGEVPADTVFETGPDAPYYRLNEDGSLYMQVLNPGTKGNKVKPDELIYFRYTRWNLSEYSDGKLPVGEGNNTSLGATWFRYGDYQLANTYKWGTGIQYPLSLLPVDCEVNIIIKSTDGPTDETADVIPYLYNITYRRPEL